VGRQVPQARLRGGGRSPPGARIPRRRHHLRWAARPHRSRLVAGESAPAVASDCGTSRKTIIGHYQEDLGDDFERPYPPFEEQLARAHVEVARIWVPPTPATETLRCEAGDHDWERPRTPGTKPRSCPEHRRKRAGADLIELMPRTDAGAGSGRRLRSV